jgi:predicted MFS family arabinose efflux permease
LTGTAPAHAGERTAPPMTLFVVTGALSLSNGAVFALLAELQDRFGFETWGLGLIAGSAFMSGFAAHVGVARYADRGYARRLLLGGLLLAATGTVGMGVGSNLLAFVASRLLIGFGFGMFIPAARRLVISADPARAGQLLGRLASFSVGGFVLGPPLAAGVASVAGPRAPFLAIAVVVLLCLPPVLRTEVVEVRRQAEPRVVRQLLALPAFQASLLVGAAFYLSIGVFEAVWARLLTDLGASTLAIGLTLLGFGVVMASFAPIGGRLADRFGGFRVAATAMVLTVPVMALYGHLTSLVALSVLIAVHAFSDGTVTPGTQLGVTRAAPEQHAAAAQGLLEAVGFLMAAIAAMGAAPVYQAVGAAWLFGGAGLCMLAFVLLGTQRARAGRSVPLPVEPPVG